MQGRRGVPGYRRVSHLAEAMVLGGGMSGSRNMDAELSTVDGGGICLDREVSCELL